jgi:hypothetical protein
VGAGENGAHDEEDIGKDGGCVDAVWDGGDVVAAGADGEAAGLPGVEEVSDEDGDGDAGKDLAGYEVDGETADGGEADDEEEVREAGKEEAEEAVYVS